MFTIFLITKLILYFYISKNIWKYYHSNSGFCKRFFHKIKRNKTFWKESYFKTYIFSLNSWNLFRWGWCYQFWAIDGLSAHILVLGGVLCFVLWVYVSFHERRERFFPDEMGRVACRCQWLSVHPFFNGFYWYPSFWNPRRQIWLPRVVHSQCNTWFYFLSHLHGVNILNFFPLIIDKKSWMP